MRQLLSTRTKSYRLGLGRTRSYPPVFSSDRRMVDLCHKFAGLALSLSGHRLPTCADATGIELNRPISSKIDLNRTKTDLNGSKTVLPGKYWRSRGKGKQTLFAKAGETAKAPNLITTYEKTLSNRFHDLRLQQSCSRFAGTGSIDPLIMQTLISAFAGQNIPACRWPCTGR